LHLVQVFRKSGSEVEQLGQVFMNAIRYEMAGMNIPGGLRIISRNNRRPNQEKRQQGKDAQGNPK